MINSREWGVGKKGQNVYMPQMVMNPTVEGRNSKRKSIITSHKYKNPTLKTGGRLDLFPCQNCQNDQAQISKKYPLLGNIGHSKQASYRHVFHIPSLKLTAKTPENEWLEDEMAVLDCVFPGAMLVLRSVFDCNAYRNRLKKSSFLVGRGFGGRIKTLLPRFWP